MYLDVAHCRLCQFYYWKERQLQYSTKAAAGQRDESFTSEYDGNDSKCVVIN